MSEEIEWRLTRKLSQEFSRTESHTLDALSKLQKFHLNPQVWVHSRSAPEISQNPSTENQESNEGRPRNHPQPKARVSLSQSWQICCPDHAYDNKQVKLRSSSILWRYIWLDLKNNKKKYSSVLVQEHHPPLWFPRLLRCRYRGNFSISNLVYYAFAPQSLLSLNLNAPIFPTVKPRNLAILHFAILRFY